MRSPSDYKVPLKVKGDTEVHRLAEKELQRRQIMERNRRVELAAEMEKRKDMVDKEKAKEEFKTDPRWGVEEWIHRNNYSYAEDKLRTVLTLNIAFEALAAKVRLLPRQSQERTSRPRPPPGPPPARAVALRGRGRGKTRPVAPSDLPST